MKATQKDFASVAARVAREARLFFLCGPDESGASDAAAKLISLLDDPGERIEMSGAELRRDPVRLGDEARSTSLFGGTRHIYVRAQGDEAHDAVKTLIENEVEGCPVLIVATGATDKSRTAKLLAGRGDALVGMFYPPDLSSVTTTVRTLANGAGLKMGSEVAQRIARAAGLDTRLARSEVEKLALYLDAVPEAPQAVTMEALDAIGASTEDDAFGPLVDTILGGKRELLASELKRMHDLQINPVGLLLALERRVAQLAALNAQLGANGDVGVLLESEAKARRVFWKDKPALAQQLRVWRGPRLDRLVSRLVALHQNLLSNSQDSELLLADGLVRIARMAIGSTKQRVSRTT
ncbi:DNA polymerase III subunit delta [Novosphingobium sp. BW1]|uniref:DNA polymerase III subunit delta n=1 Tax=Novosphingobium sp. BW1 TaxID=2592621 RepID=UPI0011DEB03C|nr:DNA polymerase III subunit delta [Novosphingobium sp. BW1]TYC90050.1 DNA polymerase III subunit delta [Novosphingobium sp. BW1]